MLATRCPTCGTVFRVVPDQLRISEGWVRCGRCAEAFNAQEAMVEWPPRRAPDPPTAGTPPAAEIQPAPADAPVEAAGSSTPPTPAELWAETPVASAAEAVPWPADLELVATDGAVDFASSPPLPPEAPDTPQAASAPAADSAEPDADTLSEVIPASDAPHAEPGLDGPPAAQPEARSDAPPDTAATAREEASHGLPPTPSFVVQAERAARWRSPGVRVALALATLLALLGLGAQAGFVWRDRIAAAYPAARPLLQQACAALGCRVEDYRQIDALSVESSGLLRQDGAPVYRLAVTLRNRAAFEVAAPALDLSLTDAQGRQIARRVMTMRDLGMPLRTLGPGSEMPIQAPLAIDGAVSGYTVEIFYP